MRDNDVPPGKSENSIESNQESPDREQSILHEENQIEKDLKKVEQEDQISEEKDDVEWDGSEAERVLDDDIEEYEEDTTGIKITYKLEQEEAYDSLKKCNIYDKSKGQQKTQTIVQCVLILLLLLFAIVTKKSFYMILMLIPILSIIGIWTIPIIYLKRIAKDLFSDKDISLEIFPDKIDVEMNGLKKEVILDGSYSYEEIDDVIVINLGFDVLLIPIRCIEPEFLPDVQAMLIAGTHPSKKD